jgi:flavin-dependent dehydrogenase
MGRLYERLAHDAVRAGVEVRLGTRYVGRQGDGFLLQDRHGSRLLRARFVVGADGARSRVAVDLGLDRNRHLLAGAEEVYDTSAVVEPTFHCVIDPLVAPGYLAWLINDGRHAHVGLAGYPDRFARGLREAMEQFAGQGASLAGLDRPDQVERRAGLIPVGGLLRRISSRKGLLVGDAAGAVSPLTAGGLDPCLRLSDHAVDVLDAALRSGRPEQVRAFDGADLRARFTGRLLLRRALSSVRHRVVAQTAFRGLRTSAGRAAARRILFADRSFPEVQPGRQARHARLTH